MQHLPPPQQSSSSSSSCRVLGIALIVDQLGKGPRMVVRYPSGGSSNSSKSSQRTRNTTTKNNTNKLKQSLTISSSSNGSNIVNHRSSTDAAISNSMNSSTGSSKNSTNDPQQEFYPVTVGGNSTSSTGSGRASSSATSLLQQDIDNNLFYQLSGRQMSKLFRPKPALCGQPITLTIDQTYFCCCAVLMNHNNNNNNNNESNTATALPIPSTTATTTTTGSTTSTVVSDNTNHNTEVCSNLLPTDASSTATKDQPLVLFSIVVALTPSLPVTSSLLRPLGTLNNPMHISLSDGMNNNNDNNNLNNPIFPCIRRVHIALTRICRVLEREERRCRYVSCQTALYEQIRSEITSATNTKTNTASTTTVMNHHPTSSTILNDSTTNKSSFVTTSTSASNLTSNTDNKELLTTTTPTTTTSHRRTGSFSFSSLDNITAAVAVTTTQPPPISMKSSSNSESTHSMIPSSPLIELVRLQELEQIILETIMTAPRTRYCMTSCNDIEYIHAGNLAQELSQVYHALATTDATAVVRRDVYINGHIAVSIDAITTVPKTLTMQPLIQQSKVNSKSTPSIDRSTFSSPNSNSIVVRPYMTILFPHNTPDQILDSLTYGATTNHNQITQPQPPQRRRHMQEFLRVWNPQKPLSDIAKEMYTPIQTTLDMAQQLVQQGLCILSPVLSYSICFVCPNIRHIQQMTLPFYQKFGISNINLFVLVSYLTESNRTFGMSISQLVRGKVNPNNDNDNNNDDPINTLLRIPIVTSILSRSLALSVVENDDDGNVQKLQQALLKDKNNIHQVLAMEELVYEMIIWLCSHQVIVPLQEYLVLLHPNPNDTAMMMVPSSISQQQQQQGTMSGMMASSASLNNNNNNNSNSSQPIEERKLDENIVHSLSSISKTQRSDPNTNKNNNNNNENDEYIWQNIVYRCFRMDQQQQQQCTRSTTPLLLLECCYRTGIDERMLRAFVTRHSHVVRLVVNTIIIMPHNFFKQFLDEK